MPRTSSVIWFWTLLGLVAVLTGCGGGNNPSPLSPSGDAGISPAIKTMMPGAVIQLTMTPPSGVLDPHFDWAVREDDGGQLTVNADTMQAYYKAPEALDTYHVDVTCRENRQIVTATITVSDGSRPEQVVITSADLPAQPGADITLTASVTGLANTAVTWTVRETNGGTLTVGENNTVVYHAPDTAGTYHVIATSVADATVNSAVGIPVGNTLATAFCVTPAEVTLTAGCTQYFNATAVGATLPALHWRVDPNGSYSGGTAPTNIMYTAPMTPGTYHVEIFNPLDESFYTQAVVTVNASAALVHGAR